MARGPRKHLKRLNAPNHWMLDKMTGVWAPRPSTGPHKLRECMPLIVLIRNRLKYALTYREVQLILKDRSVLVDGKVRTDPTFPTGFMDVIQLRKSGELFRLVYDAKGRFNILPISREQAKFKLCRVRRVQLGAKGIPFLVTHDGRTIRYPNPEIRPGDTVKVDIADGRITDFVKNENGNVCMVTGGQNVGRVGVISHMEKHPGSFTAVHITDAKGTRIVTRAENVFILGRGAAPLISLPKDEGIRPDIFENRERELVAQRRDARS